MRETHFIGLMVFLTYVLVALAVQNLYPFSTFPMYSKAAKTSGARLIALDEHGRDHEVTDFGAWSCPDLKPIQRVICPDGTRGKPEAYLVKEATDYIRANWSESPTDDQRTVELIVRVWVFPKEGGEAPPRDCPIHTCRAVLK